MSKITVREWIEKFNEIFDRIRNRIWIPISDTELVEMIVIANMNGTIDDEEKELLLEMI